MTATAAAAYLAGASAVFFLLFGVGVVVRRALALSAASDGLEVTTPALGYAGVVGLLTAWHLFRPIDGAARLGVVAVAVAGVARAISERRRRARPAGTRARVLGGTALVFAVALAAAHAARTAPEAYDVGLYHLQSVRWAKEYAAVPGLANLAPRLGFGSGHFLFVALLDAPGLPLRGHELVTGALLLSLLVPLAFRLARSTERLLSRDETAFSAADLASLLLVPALLSQLPAARTPTPDVAVFCLGSVLALALLAGFEGARPGVRRDALSLALVLGAAGIAAKLSAAAFGLAAVAALSWETWRSRRTGDTAEGPRPRRALGLGLALLGLWSARNVVQSGYLAFPVEASAMPVAWRVPAESAAALARQIVGWARAPGPGYSEAASGWGWFGPWLSATARHKPAALAFAFALAYLVARVARRLRERELGRPADEEHGGGRRGLHALFGASLGALGVWFLTAPDVRFAGALFWLLGIAAALLLLDRLRVAERVRLRAVVVLSAALSLRALVLSWTAPPAPPEPRVETLRVTLPSGLVVHVPAEGERCGEAPIPCTATPDARLRLRRPGDLGSGFSLAAER